MKALFISIFLILLFHGCAVNKSKTVDNTKQIISDTTAATVENVAPQCDTAMAAPSDVVEYNKSMPQCSGGGGSPVEHMHSQYLSPHPLPTTVHTEMLHKDTVVLNVEPTQINVGGIAYYIPPQMKVGVVYVVRLRISRYQSKSLSAGLPESATVAPIRVGSSMSAELTDESPDTSSFDIKPLNTAVQSVENDSSYTTWEWSLMPIRSGKQKLKLMVVIKTADLTKDIPVYEDSINVQASIPFTIKNLFYNNWKWLWTTTLMPFIVWWWKRRKNKKDESVDMANKPEL